jgi:hypothetical protein
VEGVCGAGGEGGFGRPVLYPVRVSYGELAMIFVFIGGWLICSLATTGMWVGYFNTKYPWGYRRDLSSGILFGLVFGPLGTFTAFFLSNFMQYGWRLTPKKGQQP